MRSLVFLLICLWVTTPAHAGAWLREKGSSFVSSTFTLNMLRDQSSGTYIEYGWHDDLTIGADLSFANSHLGLQSGAVTFFLRRPIGNTEGPNKWAYEIGAGTAWVQNLKLPHVKVGLSWGRGITLRDKHGWMGVDSAIFWDVSSGRRTAKLDGTIGLHFTDVTSGMLQIYVAQINQQTYGTFAPSLLIKPRNKKFRIQIGAEGPFGAFTETSIKLGLWREF